MAWDRNAPTDPKYRTPEHKAERKRWVQILAECGVVDCAQPECVMPTRAIRNGDAWHLGHDDTGTSYIGPCHPRCNTRDGALRGNRYARQPLDKDRWAL